MASQAILFESIPQTKYLSAENFTRYRAIMRLFFYEHQKMHYLLDKEGVLNLLREDSLFAQYTLEQLVLDLDQLVNWKNLTTIQDPHRAYTISEYKNRQFQYMMSQTSLEIERMTITLENLYTRAAGLSSSAFRRIHSALMEAEGLETLSLKDVGAWWQDLQEDFKRLSQNYQDYLREFYGPRAEKQVKSADFIAYKQHLIRYLEDFIQELQKSSAQIGAELERFSPERTERILALVHRSELEIPRPQSELTPHWEAELELQNRGVWKNLTEWFTGDNSTASQVMEVTNEVIRRVVQNAALLVQMQNMGVSNKAELQHFLRLFSQCETLENAHRLSAQIFGAQKCRHYTVNAERATERIDSSPYEEPPMDYALQPRVRTYKPRMDRSGFADKRAEKERQRKDILEEQARLREEVISYIQNGVLELGNIVRPVSPAVRTVFLSWVALANFSPDKQAHTEYGQTFTLRQKSSGICRLPCTDGCLTLPDYMLIFEEVRHA